MPAPWRGQYTDGDRRYLRWLPDYVQGDEVRTGQIVNQNGWLMVANKPTTDPAAPQNVGGPFYVYDGTLSNASENASQIIFGNRYTIVTTGYIEGYRVYTHPGQRYVVYSVLDPLGEKRISQISDFTATSEGWVEVNASPVFVGGITLDLVVTVTGPNPVPVETPLNYNYSTPNNDTAPLSGQATQSTKTTSVINFNYIDVDTNDNEAFFLTLDTGDTITGGGVKWTIQDITYFADYVAFEVVPATQGAAGSVTFVFGSFPDIPVQYEQDVDYWLTSPYTVQGLYGANIPYDQIVPDNTARGADIRVQGASFSDDWDVLTYSGSSSVVGGGSGADGTIVQSARFGSSANLVWSNEPGWSGRDDGVGAYTVFFPTTASANTNQSIQVTLNTTTTSAAGIMWVDNITTTSCRVRLANSGGVSFDNGFAIHRIVG